MKTIVPGAGIPVTLNDTLKLLSGTEIMTYAETIPSWFLLKVNLVQLK